MAVKEFELFHGAVLTKLARSKKPLTLCMIETRSADSWSTYRVNDEVRLLIKHSLTGRSLKREAAKVWSFVFSPDQIRQLQEPGTWAALVCGSKIIGGTDMEVCLLEPSELASLIDLSTTTQQSAMVKRLDGKGLRVSSSRIDERIVNRNRLDVWDVPGS